MKNLIHTFILCIVTLLWHTDFTIAQVCTPTPPVCVGTGGLPAFVYSGNTNFGLYFNDAPGVNEYQFTNSSGNKVFGIKATTGAISFGPNGALQVGANKPAFQFAGDPDAGLYFIAGTPNRYEFRSLSGLPVFSIAENSGDLNFLGKLSHPGLLSIEAVLDIEFLIDKDDSGLLYAYFELFNGKGMNIFNVSEDGDINTTGYIKPGADLTVYDGDINLNSQVGSLNIGFLPGNGNRWEIATSNSGEDLVFLAGPNASSLSDPVVFKQNGTVGIGTSVFPAPIAKLHVNQEIDEVSGLFTNNFPSPGTKAVHGEFTGDSLFVDAIGVFGKSTPVDFYGIGGSFEGRYIGSKNTVFSDGSTPLAAYAGTLTECYGGSQNSTNYGLYAIVEGGDTSSTNYAVYGYTGSIGTSYAGYFDGDVSVIGTFTNPSDRKLKRNLKSIDNAMELINRLDAKSYEFKTNEFPFMRLATGPQYGLIAQDVEKVLPEIVHQGIHPGPDPMDKTNRAAPVEYKSIDYISLVPILVQALKEQHERSTAMEHKISGLEKALSTCCLREDSGILIPDDLKIDDSWLGQNIPNPFDRSTTIQYYIPENSSNSFIKVFNMEGSEIKHFILSNGFGKIQFSDNELPAGAYVYSLVSDGRVISTKKMILK